MGAWDDTTRVLTTDGLTIDIRPEPHLFKFDDHRWVQVRIRLGGGDFVAVVEGTLFPEDVEEFAAGLETLEKGGTARFGGGRALLLELDDYHVVHDYEDGRPGYFLTGSLTDTEDCAGQLLSQIDVMSTEPFHHELAAKLRELLALDPWPLEEIRRRPTQGS